MWALDKKKMFTTCSVGESKLLTHIIISKNKKETLDTRPTWESVMQISTILRFHCIAFHLLYARPNLSYSIEQ